MLRKGSDKVVSLPILVQHPSGDGDEGDPRWISRWTTNWRVNGHEPLLCWWHHPVGASVEALQELVDRLDRVSHKCSLFINIDKTKIMASDSIACMLHTLSEWTTGARGYVPVPWVPDYRRWWVYDGIPYQVKQRVGDQGINAENMEKSQHTDFND